MASCAFKPWFWRSGMIALALTFSNLTPPTQAAASPTPPLASGYARIWLYRDYQPTIARDLANVELNGARVASVPPHGGALYRDVPAGSYRLTVENSTDKNKSKTIGLTPGQQVFAKITTSDTWLSGGQGVRRENYDFQLQSAGRAEADRAKQL